MRTDPSLALRLGRFLLEPMGDEHQFCEAGLADHQGDLDPEGERIAHSPGADATGKRRIDGDRDDGEYGQAHQELDEGEAVPPFSRSRHLTPVSSTSRRRWLAAVPAEPMKP